MIEHHEATDQALSTLPTEARDPRTAALDALAPLALMEAMHRADNEAVAAVGAVLPSIAAAVEAAAQRMGAGGRLIYVGAGTSGRLGVLDASECPPTFSTPPEMVVGVIAGGDRALRWAAEGAEDSADGGLEAIRSLGVRSLDTVVGIAASGRTPYVLGALTAAREVGALTIGLSCVPGSAVERAADLAITPATGPEVVTGSTRLKAGTATKLALNMLSTGALVRLGYVYGNLMVNVRASNAKLRDRATRIVAELAGVPQHEAGTLLKDAGGEVKVAVAMHRLGVDATEARRRLDTAGGVLRRVIG